VCRECKARRGHRARLEHRVCWVQQEQPEASARKGRRESQDRLGRRGFKEWWVLQDCRGRWA
jgi:hypothetical protein